MHYLSVREVSEKWNLSRRRVQILCNQQRIEGAVRIGYLWAIPDTADKPKDARVVTGKYMKK
ncbi:MAG: DNA-binding protein [Oscillospiraceae bacterium]|nr:DNA-binding protein [Oscillospiraceae bacterium]